MAKEQGPRARMPKQPPAKRAHNFDEVALGLDREQALAEARRCLQCRQPACVAGCPVGIDIPGFIRSVAEDDMETAARVLKDRNNLPGICGRVCPQESQCEKECILGRRAEPIAIGALERYVADWEMQHSQAIQAARKHKQAVAVVGSGPAGLTASADLARMGHPVTLLESLHAVGGVLRYGIPPFRIPRDILDREVDYVRRLGVEVEPNVVVGKTVAIDELRRDGYRAIFIATGAGLPYFLGIPGENSNGVYSANEFLTRINLMQAHLFPEYDTPIVVGERVAVVGGGNTAMDAARCAVRMGAREVTIVYRRSERELPARDEEVQNAKEEGVRFVLLTDPTRIVSDNRGWVRAMECLRMELGEPDASGRRRPVPVPGSEFAIEVDTVVAAIGQGPNPLVPRTTPGLQVGEGGVIVADAETGETSIPGVFAGGDVATNAGTVIAAMGDAKQAASSIDAYLRR